MTGPRVNEGDLATVIWRACLDADRPIDVPTSRTAAAAVLAALDSLPDRPERRPPLMVQLHERVLPSEWENPGLLASALRRYAGLLDARSHRSMMDAL